VAGIRSRLRELAHNHFVVAVDETGRRVRRTFGAQERLHEMTDVVGSAVLEIDRRVRGLGAQVVQSR